MLVQLERRDIAQYCLWLHCTIHYRHSLLSPFLDTSVHGFSEAVKIFYRHSALFFSKSFVFVVLKVLGSVEVNCVVVIMAFVGVLPEKLLFRSCTYYIDQC